MYLALRTKAASNATLAQKLFCEVTKARLVSDYCHGGIVIGGDLYQSNMTHGLHKVPAGEWTPGKWWLVDVGPHDAQALELFNRHAGAHYDWVGLLAFLGFHAGRDDWMYCFEWCWLAMTGKTADFRVTPEKLLVAAMPNGLRVRAPIEV